MKFSNLAERMVTLGWNPCQIVLAIRIIVPIVARKTGTAREQRGYSSDDWRVLDAELRGCLHITIDELLVRDKGLQ